MTSEPGPLFVWTWLPEARDPVVAGRLDRAGPMVTFTYGQSYLGRDGAIPLFLPELPLVRGPISPMTGEVAGVIADAAPDAWGQRVILARRQAGAISKENDLDILAYLIESGSDRFGALDFQRSATEYAAREGPPAPLAELVSAAELIEAGEQLSPDLDRALLRGSSIGGARPKALLTDGTRSVIAKFSSTSDTYPVVKGEFLAMSLAARAGLDAATVRLTSALGKDVLLIDRFDRPGDGVRRAVVSGLTMLGLDWLAARYASYADLADTIRARFRDARATLRELFARIIFNILTGNTDDHGRNHAAFWDGRELALTPLYDVCPQPRGGGEATQGMAIGRDGWRFSNVAGCIERAAVYQLSQAEAREVVDGQIEHISRDWDDACDLARLTRAERDSFWRRQFLNDYALQGYRHASISPG